MSWLNKGRGWSVDTRMGLGGAVQHFIAAFAVWGMLNWWTRGTISGDLPAGNERDVVNYSLPSSYSTPARRDGFAGGDGSMEENAEVPTIFSLSAFASSQQQGQNHNRS